MKKRLRINENTLTNLIRKCIISEMDWSKAEDIKDNVNSRNNTNQPDWEKIKYACEDIIEEVNFCSNYSDTFPNSQFITKFLPMVEKMSSFCQRKLDQVENISDMADEKFSDHFGTDKQTYDNEMMKKWDNHVENWDNNSDEDRWESFENGLSPLEREYADKHM